ncbi:unnamed protein product [Amoebophrya sp. A25]|nr:unnamed protein product [Amoebophrya sp. A25]|eukprot:GSA25T00022646001.1
MYCAGVTRALSPPRCIGLNSPVDDFRIQPFYYFGSKKTETTCSGTESADAGGPIITTQDLHEDRGSRGPSTLAQTQKNSSLIHTPQLGITRRDLGPTGGATSSSVSLEGGPRPAGAKARNHDPSQDERIMLKPGKGSPQRRRLRQFGIGKFRHMPSYYDEQPGVRPVAKKAKPKHLQTQRVHETESLHLVENPFSTGTSQWMHVRRPQEFFRHTQVAPFLGNEKYQDQFKFGLQSSSFVEDWLGMWGEIHGRRATISTGAHRAKEGEASGSMEMGSSMEAAMATNSIYLSVMRGGATGAGVGQHPKSAGAARPPTRAVSSGRSRGRRGSLSANRHPDRQKSAGATQVAGGPSSARSKHEGAAEGASSEAGRGKRPETEGVAERDLSAAIRGDETVTAAPAAREATAATRLLDEHMGGSGDLTDSSKQLTTSTLLQAPSRPSSMELSEKICILGRPESAPAVSPVKKRSTASVEATKDWVQNKEITSPGRGGGDGTISSTVYTEAENPTARHLRRGNYGVVVTEGDAASSKGPSPAGSQQLNATSSSTTRNGRKRSTGPNTNQSASATQLLKINPLSAGLDSLEKQVRDEQSAKPRVGYVSAHGSSLSILQETQSLQEKNAPRPRMLAGKHAFPRGPDNWAEVSLDMAPKFDFSRIYPKNGGRRNRREDIRALAHDMAVDRCRARMPPPEFLPELSFNRTSR